THPEVKSYIESFNAGGSRRAVTKGHIESFRLPLPPLPEQRAIARILGTLDDKIELNRRMNETLEAMAQALFKSWFVDFDPVVVNAIKAGNPIPEKFADRAAHYHDNPDALGLPEDLLRLFPARFVDSELGPIPEGWEVKHLADAIEIHDSKRIPLNSRERAAHQGPYPYYGAAGIMDYVDDYLFDGIYVLIGEDGSVIDDKGHPVTQYVWGQFWVNNHAHVLTGYGISNEHLYLILQNTNIRAFVTGAVQPKISQKNLKAIPYVHSGENISRVFASQIVEYFRKIRSINEESRTLSALRDTLLPKLISGELRVPNVEKILEDAQ
ncbi:MAG TPA: restriction endonuclease subunit S, partial [Candidatus Hydrogenedentes bacterium]|nr:restriction endonuclease subunit S [Candidatus Hydrogenedentota bacterium]